VYTVTRMSLADLVGAWTLARATVTGPDGAAAHPFGRDPQGVLLYTADGWMSATITSVDETTETPGPVLYAGRVAVRGDEVIHSVVVGVPPCGPGSAQRRLARLDAPGLLVLTTPPGADVGQGIQLRWRRLA
jgi:hypothetical protein